MVSSLPLCGQHSSAQSTSPHPTCSISGQHQLHRWHPGIVQGENQCEYAIVVRVELDFLSSGLTLSFPGPATLQATVTQVLDNVDKAKDFLDNNVAAIVKSVSGGREGRVSVT